MAGLSTIIEDNKFTPADVPELESKLFFEGDRSRRHLVRFTILLFLSAVIATQGVIEDSTATVIGAMIIAPLMNPIVATTAALVMGKRASRMALISPGCIGHARCDCRRSDVRHGGSPCRRLPRQLPDHKPGGSTVS